MSEIEIPVTMTVESPRTFVFVPEKTLHFGHSLGDSVSEELGIVTLRTANMFAHEGDSPSFPTCLKQNSDGSSAADDDDEKLKLHTHRVPPRSRSETAGNSIQSPTSFNRSSKIEGA